MDDILTPDQERMYKWFWHDENLFWEWKKFFPMGAFVDVISTGAKSVKEGPIIRRISISAGTKEELGGHFGSYCYRLAKATP